jgi:5-(carboxyamino)imidazole ribonucleotide mutase
LQLFTYVLKRKIDDCTHRTPPLNKAALDRTISRQIVSEAPPLVGIIMGSRSDWETMREASAILAALYVPHECKVVSAHRTPDRLYDYAKSAAGRGLKCIIAGAGGAAHLPGMAAAMTRLPVLGVPVESKALSGMDSLLSIVQMPAGIPVGTLAIGKAGATNAALLAAAMLANEDADLAARLEAWREKQTASVGDTPE